MNQANINHSTMNQPLTPDVLSMSNSLASDAEIAIITDLVTTKRDQISLMRAKKSAAEQLGLTMSQLEKIYKAELAQTNIVDDEKSESGQGLLFEEVEPWQSPVDGAALLDNIFATLKRYVIANDETLQAASLWVCMTWLVDYATVLPLAIITSAEKNSGKSTLLNAMAKMAFKPLQAANTTGAAAFRVIEAERPTLFFEESDTVLRNNEEMRSIINSGYTRDSANVLRTVGNDHKTKKFSTWGAKAVCGLGHLHETIESRAIPLRMRRKRSGEHAESLRHADPALFDTIKQKLARWCDDNAQEFSRLKPVMAGLNNRDADNFEPIYAIALLAGGSWPEHIVQAARILTQKDDDNRSVGVDLLDACRTVFDTLKTIDKISSVKLTEAISRDEETRFATYNRGKPMTVKQLSRYLGQYGIRSKSIRLSDGQTRKGFEKIQFHEAFSIYLDGAEDSADSLLPASHDAASSITQTNLNVDDATASAISEYESVLTSTSYTDSLIGTPQDDEKVICDEAMIVPIAEKQIGTAQGADSLGCTDIDVNLCTLDDKSTAEVVENHELASYQQLMRE